VVYHQNKITSYCNGCCRNIKSGYASHTAQGHSAVGKGEKKMVMFKFLGLQKHSTGLSYVLITTGSNDAGQAGIWTKQAIGI
jgi:hypothetical protein